MHPRRALGTFGSLVILQDGRKARERDQGGGELEVRHFLPTLSDKPPDDALLLEDHGFTISNFSQTSRNRSPDLLFWELVSEVGKNAPLHLRKPTPQLAAAGALGLLSIDQKL